RAGDEFLLLFCSLAIDHVELVLEGDFVCAARDRPQGGYRKVVAVRKFNLFHLEPDDTDHRVPAGVIADLLLHGYAAIPETADAGFIKEVRPQVELIKRSLLLVSERRGNCSDAFLLKRPVVQRYSHAAMEGEFHRDFGLFTK